MKIVADENIPLLHEFFGGLGEIQAVQGRGMRPEQVRDADILLVRSVTQVDQDLLGGSRVRFVGTATIGCDHVDLNYLARQGIAFASAPGCNATSVVEYVISALTILGERHDFEWQRKRVGIVGLGNVGSRLKTTLERLGLSVLANDPPLAEQGRAGLVSLEDVLACDVISLHTPLTRSGGHPTYHLLNRERLARIRPDQILLNTGRGPVVEESALLDKLREQPEWPVVLDVWEHEPQVNGELLQKVQLGSAHIAGYSLDGKMRGTEMIYQALCKALGQPPQRCLDDMLPEPPVAELVFAPTVDPDLALTTAIRSCYDPRLDDALLRNAMACPPEDRGAAFDELRKKYRVRREFGRTKVRFTAPCPASQDKMAAVGFRTQN